MNFINYFKNSPILALILFLTAISSLAQTQNSPAPREEKLLNGMKLLVWSDSKAQKVNVKIRIHSGSAFDPQGKEGVMRLLSDILFPNVESIKEFFTDDLGGSLEIISNYDYIQINASGDSDKFLTILETLSAALTNPQINKETTEKARSALLVKVKELEKNPAYVADQAVAKRLLGNFPYGRPQLGSSESLQKIDFADLLFAKERFLTADNATMAISGNIKADFALRATKRLFGGWLKADKKVPSTFAQPDAPDGKIELINFPGAETVEGRIASRGLSRNDKDYYISKVLERLLQSYVEQTFPDNIQGKVFIVNQVHFLPGIWMIKTSLPPSEIRQFYLLGLYLPSGELTAFLNYSSKDSKQISFLTFATTAQFEKAKNEVVAEIKQQTLNSNSLIDLWLDVETFKLASISEQIRNVENLTFSDVAKLYERLLKFNGLVNDINELYKTPQSFNLSRAKVLVGSEELLKTEVEKFNSELRPQVMMVGPTPKPNPTNTP